MSAFLSFILPWMERAGNDVFQGDSTMNSLQNSFSGINIRAILCHPHFSNTLLAFYTPHKGHFYCFPGSFSYTKYNDLVMQLGISKNFKKKKESALTMRKQMKIAAVVSAAALLALGASITSFAAQKGTWKYEDGEWYCYDKNGDVYENTFCLSNGKEFYVGDDGALVRSSWVEYDNNYYFVNSAGEKITNDWRLTTPYEDESAEEEWFYFQSTGKRAENKKLTVKGKTYFFGNEGNMLTGWIEETNGTYDKASSDITDGTKKTFFYCDETGARLEKVWVEDYAPDVDTEDVSSDDEEHYYYLNSSGNPVTRKQTNINGQTYIFGDDGRMLTGWVGTTATNSNSYEVIQATEDDGVTTRLDVVAGRGGKAYYCTPEDGHVKKNKWIKLWNTEDAYDEDEDNDQYWFYLNKNGDVYIPTVSNVQVDVQKYKLEEGKLVKNGSPLTVAQKRINGKDYFFNLYGELVTKFVDVENNNGNNEVPTGMYYLGGSDDGVMKTGSISVADDTGESIRFYFGTKDSDGAGKGVGYTGNKSGKLYYDGMLVTAKDYRYEIVEISGYYFIVNQSGSIQHSNTSYKEDGEVLIRTKADGNGETDTKFNDSSVNGKEFEHSFNSLGELLEHDASVDAGKAEDIVRK